MTLKTDAQWPYVDVMATALALIKEEKLTASDQEWNRAWRQIVDDPDLQTLLPDVWFEERPPYPALSDQVETLRRVLLRSGVLSMQNPRYAWFAIDAGAKSSIRDSNAELLEKERSRLERMAAVLATTLAA